MSFIPRPHEIYKHFKGDLYQVTAIAEHTETGEQLVIYQALYGGFKTYARPLAMFVSRVDREKYPDAEQEFRFELQGPEAERQRAESEPEEAAGKSAGAVPGETLQKAVEPYAEGRPAMERASDAIAERQEHQESPADMPGTEEELDIDPFVLEFLDSDSYEQRLNILAGLHHRITDEMLTTMAIACDIEIGNGDTEERYEALKTCLLTLERYECNRLR